jgi:hypothetical protein
MAKQTFSVGQVLTAAQMTSLQQTAMGGGSATAKTANYVLVAADAGTTVAMNAAGTTTITVNTSLFAAGDTVYIQNLGAGVTTITAGTATVNTSASLALAQYEGGQLYFVSTSASIFIKGAGAAAGGGGKVLQVVSATTTTEASTTSATWTDSNLSASITPTLNTSKVLVLTTQNINLNQSDDTGILSGGLRLLRGATTIFQPYEGGGTSFYGSDYFRNIASLNYLDSPATTSSTTYKTQIYLSITGGGATIAAQPASCQSSIILMEIGA